MGRRRRFTQLASTSDDDDDDKAAALPPKTTKRSAPPSSAPKKQQQQPHRRRRTTAPTVAAAAADDDDDDMELEEEEDDDKALEEMRRNEEEERREETQNRRRRGRKPKRPAEESDKYAEEMEDEEKVEDEEPREEENTEALPIGDPVKVTGKGRKQRKHYTSFEYEGNTFELEDPVLLTPEVDTEKPYVAIIKDITGNGGSLSITGQWFYRPEEAEKKGGGSWKASDTRELFYSFHIDDVPAESVMHRCVVHFIPQHKKIPSRKQHPGFIVQKVYDTESKKLWNLTDKDYEDNKQHEIDLLVKKTMDRIGELPDLEPEAIPADNTDQFSNKQGPRKRPVSAIDVSRDGPTGKFEQFVKAETPGSAKLVYYDVLVRYKALTGDQHRDKCIDKLVEAILSSKESVGTSHAEDTGHGDIEKYTPDVVISIMVSLEKCMFESLGSDFQKYKQKLRQLFFNIKSNSILRKRLMNKDLDPPVLVTMSPDELKVGLTAAEKTSEPEESRQLQMTDAICQRCTEKKVGISDIIRAGHIDRYQLECDSCGHTWFSSGDAISSLTVDASNPGENVGTAPWETAKFDVLEKQLASPRDQPDKTAALEKQKSFSKTRPEETSSAPAGNRE